MVLVEGERKVSNPELRSKFGRSWWGGGALQLLSFSIFGGGVLAGVLAAWFAWWSVGPRGWVGFAVIFGFLLPVLSTLVWVVCVDRGTLRSAVKEPEESVEFFWYEKAVNGAFHDLLIILGFGCVLLVITGIKIPALQVLMVLILLAWADVGVRYLRLRKVQA